MFTTGRAFDIQISIQNLKLKETIGHLIDTFLRVYLKGHSEAPDRSSRSTTSKEHGDEVSCPLKSGL